MNRCVSQHHSSRSQSADERDGRPKTVALTLRKSSGRAAKGLCGGRFGWRAGGLRTGRTCGCSLLSALCFAFAFAFVVALVPMAASVAVSMRSAGVPALTLDETASGALSEPESETSPSEPPVGPGDEGIVPISTAGSTGSVLNAVGANSGFFGRPAGRALSEDAPPPADVEDTAPFSRSFGRPCVLERIPLPLPLLPPLSPLPRPRPRPRKLCSDSSSLRRLLGNRPPTWIGSWPRAAASSSFFCLSSMWSAVGKRRFLSAIQASIASGVSSVMDVP